MPNIFFERDPSRTLTNAGWKMSQKGIINAGIWIIN